MTLRVLAWAFCQRLRSRGIWGEIHEEPEKWSQEIKPKGSRKHTEDPEDPLVQFKSPVTSISIAISSHKTPCQNDEESTYWLPPAFPASLFISLPSTQGPPAALAFGTFAGAVPSAGNALNPDFHRAGSFLSFRFQFKCHQLREAFPDHPNYHFILHHPVLVSCF